MLHKLTGSSGLGGSTRAMLRKRSTKALQASSEPLNLLVPASSDLVAPVDSDTIALRSDLAKDVAQIRRLARQTSLKTCKAVRELHACLDEWKQRNSIEKSLVDKASQALSLDLSSLQGHIEPIPHSAFHCLEAAFDLGGIATQLAGFAANSSLHCNLHRALQLDWKQRNTPVDTTTDSADHVAGEADVVESICPKYGMCLCNPSGVQLWKMRNRMIACLKSWFPLKEKELRKLLADGSVVLCFSSPFTSAKSSLDGFLADLVDTEEASSRGPGSHFFHVGAHYFKPFRSTLQPLLVVTEVHPDKYILKQTGDYKTELQVLQEMDLDTTWDVVCYLLVDSTTPVDALQLGHCL
eukprot:6479884-Amphidinium_carterae.1